MENERDRGRKGEIQNSHKIQRLLYLSFTVCGLPYSCPALPAPLCRILAVRTGSGLFVSFLLPVGAVQSKDRNVCGSRREGRHMLCLQVTRKDLLDLDIYINANRRGEVGFTKCADGTTHDA